MSYNNYSQYSPYWQQTAGQLTPQSAGPNDGQSKTSYQPLSAYQNNQQFAQASISQPVETPSAASYSTRVYGNIAVNGAGNGRPQDFRTAYTNSNDRMSLDGATALGNPAYASSLGRDGTTQQQSSYDWQQSNSDYRMTSSYGTDSAPQIQNRTGDERKGKSFSREDTNARAQQATASPSFGYSSNNAAYQGSGAGNIMQTQTQYPQSRSASEQHRLNQYSQPSPPTSGQAIRQRSRPDSQAAPAAAALTMLSTMNQSQGKNDGQNMRGPTQTRVPTPQQPSNLPSSSQTPGLSGGHTQRPQSQQGDREKGTKYVAKSATKSEAAASVSALETAAKRVSNVRQSPTDANRQSSKPATPVEPQYTTVDPSQVFNLVEYSRRQAAAAAKKAAEEEAEASRTATTQTKQSRVNKSSTAPLSLASEPDTAKNDQMELEMKQMIEKLRDYKAKDPSLFTEIWEQVKKSQTPQRASSQLLQGSSTSSTVVNGQLPSSSLIQNHLPLKFDLPASDETPSDSDRGKFPAQRRRRGGGKMASTGRNSGIPNDSTKPMAETQTAKNQGNQLPPEIAIPTPKVGQIFPDPASQSIVQAMQQFHQNSTLPLSKAQQIPDSNKQDTMNSSVGPSKAPSSTGTHSQPVPAQPAPPPKPGRTCWPESRKKALAEAARNALTSTPHNKGKAITTQEINELMDQNPSYTQMCEILEYRGFVIDRGHFARILLKAVPDLGSVIASNPANPASTNSASASDTTPTDATPPVTAVNNSTSKAISSTPIGCSFGMLVKAPSHDSTAQRKVPQSSPYFAPPPAATQAPNAFVEPYAPAAQSAEQASGGFQSNGLPRDYRFVDPTFGTPFKPHYHASNPNQGPQEPSFHSHLPFLNYQQSGSVNGQATNKNETIHSNKVIPHPTKQEMARKRTFGEIVDLTTLSDEEELERRRPNPETDNESAFDSSKAANNIFDQSARLQKSNGRSTPKPFKYKQSGRDALLLSSDIVQPMNKRQQALRRSSYNPKTIARDILLGIGKHPFMAPLNSHLDVLKDRFKAVDNESNLSTFRWDLVDPETEANIRSSNLNDEETVPASIPESRQRPAPIAVMVNGDGDSHVNDDQTSSRKRGPSKKTEIRSGVKPIGSADTPKRQLPQSSPHAQEMSKVSGTTSTDLSRFANTSPYTAQKDLTTLISSDTGTSGSAVKRKRRGPGAKNKQIRPDKGIQKKPKTRYVGATPSTANAKALDEGSVERTISVESTSFGKPSSSTPTRRRVHTTTPFGPSGLTKFISAMTPKDGIAVVVSSRSPSVAVNTQFSAKKGRSKNAEARSENRSIIAPVSAHNYTIYGCHWENCPAELHSLEILKKHVKKHCRAVDGVYPCSWAGCSDSSNLISNNTQNEDGQYKRLKFKTCTEWITHMESNHLGIERELSHGARGSGSIGAKSGSNGSRVP